MYYAEAPRTVSSSHGLKTGHFLQQGSSSEKLWNTFEPSYRGTKVARNPEEEQSSLRAWVAASISTQPNRAQVFVDCCNTAVYYLVDEQYF